MNILQDRLCAEDGLETRNKLGAKWLHVAAWVVLGCWFLMGIAYVVWGRYTADEGFYSVIAREVWKGRLLYEDVRCSQMPLLPYLYGGILQFLPARIESGRAVSLLLTFVALGFGWRLVAQRYGERAGLVGLLILVLSRQFIFDVTQVRTQALAFSLALICLFGLSNLDLNIRKRSDKALADEPPDEHPGYSNLAALACITGCLAGMTMLARLSFLPLAVAVPLYVMWAAKRGGIPQYRRIALIVAFASLGLPIVVGMYFFWSAGDRFLFNVYGYHKMLGAMVSTPQPKLLLIGMTDAIRTEPVWTLVLVLSTMALLQALLCQWRDRTTARSATKRSVTQLPSYSFEAFVLVIWIVISVLQLMQPMFSIAHQTPLGWAFLILGAYTVQCVLAFRSTFWGGETGRWLLPALCITMLSVLCWPLQEGQLYSSRSERFRTPAGIYELAAPLRSHPGRTLVAFEPGLAYCAPQIHLLPGYEMGEWSLVPKLGPDRQEYFRGVSGRKLRSDLKSRADFFAAREWDFVNLNAGDPGFNMESMSGLMSEFELVYEVPAYGHLNQSLSLWQRKN